MNKDQAFKVAVEGKLKIKRKDWPAGTHVFVKDGRFYIASVDKETELYLINDKVEDGKTIRNPDRYATDWAIYKDDIESPVQAAPDDIASFSLTPKPKFVNLVKE